VKQTYNITTETTAIGSCPFDPNHNSTYVFSGKIKTIDTFISLL